MLRTFAALVLFVSVAAAVLLLSFYEREIHTAESQINGVVRVTQNFRGVRFLRFGDGDEVQSAIDLNNPAAIVAPYVRVSLAAFSFSGRKPLRVLVIGMGAGSQAVFARRFLDGVVVDAVEVDSVVVDTARSFFGFQSDQHLSAHVADGRRFVEEVSRPYDVVLIDAFNGVDVPPHLVTADFFQAVRRALAPGGVVASNVLFRDISPRYDSIVKTMNDALGEGVSAFVPGGPHQRILFHRPDGLPRPEVMPAAAEAFAAANGFPAGVGRLYRVESALPVRGVIYRDLLPTATASFP